VLQCSVASRPIISRMELERTPVLARLWLQPSKIKAHPLYVRLLGAPIILAPAYLRPLYVRLLTYARFVWYEWS
jgi:hypothetical protein